MISGKRNRRHGSAIQPIFRLRSWNQANGSTTFTEEINGWTPTNPSSLVKHSTAVGGYGGSSSTIYFPGTDGGYLQFTNAVVGTTLDFGTDDCAIKLNVRPTTVTHFDIIIMKATPFSWGTGWAVWENQTGSAPDSTFNAVGFGAPYATRAVTGYNTYVPGTWYELIWQRSSGVWSMYINRVFKASIAKATSPDTTNDLIIGGDSGSGPKSIDAHMQNIELYDQLII